MHVHAPEAFASRIDRLTVGCMGRTITQRELSNQTAAIINAVMTGDRFIVTRNGTPVATNGSRDAVVAKLAARQAHRLSSGQRYSRV